MNNDNISLFLVVFPKVDSAVIIMLYDSGSAHDIAGTSGSIEQNVENDMILVKRIRRELFAPCQHVSRFITITLGVQSLNVPGEIKVG